MKQRYHIWHNILQYWRFKDFKENIENIAKQITTPIMNDLSNQIDELKNEINSTQEIIQKSSNEEGNFTIF